MSILHRIVGVVSLGLVWAVTWASIGAALSFVAGIVAPGVIDRGEGPADLARIMGPVGGVSGVVFGLLLALVERGKAIADVRPLRAVLWGIVAAVAVRLLTSITEAAFSNIVVLGAVSGAVSVALARLSRLVAVRGSRRTL